jgi:WD40 repeat protein
VDIEPRVRAEILTDVGDQPGALPMLQYALTELFEQREDSLVTMDSYRRIGGISGAIAGRAEGLYESQGPTGQDAARQLFLRLVTVGEEGAEDTRRRVLRSELASLEVDRGAMEKVIDAFGAHRLLSFDRDPVTRGPTVEVAHEALLREWARLREWVERAREDLRMHRRLAAAAKEWVDANRDRSFLLRGSRLTHFDSWVDSSSFALASHEREYIEASLRDRRLERAAEEARQTRERALERRSVNRLRAIVAVLSVAAVVASALTIVASNQRRRADEQAQIATARQLAANAVANLEKDPELGILLALRAVDMARPGGGPALWEAEDVLHQAVQASRVVMRLPIPAVSVAFSSDGSRMATAGVTLGVAQSLGAGAPSTRERDTKAFVWDSKSGKLLLTLSGHRARVWEVEFSPDGSRIATGSEDGTAAIWDAETGRRLITLAGHKKGSWIGVGFSPDGTTLVTTDTAGALRLWDARTGRLERELSAPGALCGAVFSPDGTGVSAGLCAESGGTAFVWDARTGKRVLTLRGAQSWILWVAFSPDGSRIASASLDGTTKVWDAKTGEELLTLSQGGWVLTAAFSPDGRSVATGGTDGTARIWNATTGAPGLVLSGAGTAVGDVEFSPDGRYLLAGTDQNSVVWDISLRGRREQATLVGHSEVTSVAYSPDGMRLLTTDSNGAALWDASSGRKVRAFHDSHLVADATFFRNGARFVTASFLGAPVIWDTRSMDRVRSLRVTGPIGSVTVSPDGSMIATARGASHVARRISLWAASSGKLIRTLDPLDTRKGESDDIEFSPDGRLLATASYDGTATLWRVSSGQQLRTFHHEGGVAGVAFSPDGKLLGTAGFDGKATVWDVATGKRISTLVGHSGIVWDVAWSADGEFLATAGQDNTARLWDASTGRELLSLAGHTSGISEVAFSPDGTRLAASSNDGTTSVYVLDVDQLSDLARSRLTRTWTENDCRTYLRLERCAAVER